MENNIEKARIGLFGGTFNPLHMGHINSMLSLTKRLGFKRIYAIPAHQNPLKAPAAHGPSPEQRLEMVRQGLADYDDVIYVDGREVERGGTSYTIDTISAYAQEYSPEDIHLIIGIDEFEVFDRWKNFAEILALANLVVTSRPGGGAFPLAVENLPKGIQKLVAAFDRHYVELDSGRNIQFIELNDLDISATEVRKRLRTGKNVDKYLPLKVENFIRENGLYQIRDGKAGDYQKLTTLAADVLFSKKGVLVRGFDLRKVEAPCDFTLIASGTSTRHAQALAENVVRSIKEEIGLDPVSVEGHGEARWILIDYGALMVHIFYDFVRHEYRLEDLWREGQDLRLLDPYLGKPPG